LPEKIHIFRKFS